MMPQSAGRPLGFAFRLLFLICAAGVCAPVFAQGSTCGPTAPQEDGPEMSLRLGYVCDGQHNPVQVGDPSELSPGETINGCYRARDNQGNWVSLNVTCTICVPTTSTTGCYEFPVDEEEGGGGGGGGGGGKEPILSRLMQAVRRFISA